MKGSTGVPTSLMRAVYVSKAPWRARGSVVLPAASARRSISPPACNKAKDQRISEKAVRHNSIQVPCKKCW